MTGRSGMDDRDVEGRTEGFCCMGEGKITYHKDTKSDEGARVKMYLCHFFPSNTQEKRNENKAEKRRNVDRKIRKKEEKC